MATNSLGNITADVLVTIDREVHGFAQAGFEALTDPVSNLMTMLLVLAVAHALYSFTITGAGGNFIQLTVRYALIWGVATSWSFFAPIFYDVITGTPDDVLKIIVGATGLETGAKGGISAIIVAFLDTGVKIGDQLIENSGMRTLAIAFVGIIILFMMLVIAAGVILVAGVSKIGIGMLTAIAPLFIAMLVFRGTKGFFDGWLRLVVSFAITYLMAMLSVGFLLFLAEDVLLDYESRGFIDNVGEIIEFLLIMTLTLFLLRQVPSFGAAIAGSAAIGIDGIATLDRGLNRIHGLRGDGRPDHARANRKQARQNGIARIDRGIAYVTGRGNTAHPSRARNNAVEAATRSDTTARKAALNRFIPDPDGHDARPGDDGFDLMTRRDRE